MMSNKGLNKKYFVMIMVSVFGLALVGFAQAAQEHQFANGINATVYSAVEIEANPRLAGIDLSFGDRQYYPFDEAEVIAALGSMHGFETDVDIEVYILPAPPALVASSYASRSAIYLAPGIGEVAASTVAYITTHEMGHVLTWAFMDGDSSRWDAYLDLRGLDAVTNGPSAAHADRAREILAEDFRFLFGGSLATSSASIENHDLVLPSRVEGLEKLLVDFVAGRAMVAVAVSSTAFPNPCNPRTTVALTINTGAAVAADQAILRVFDLRGALVKTIAGGELRNNQVQIQWNGDNENGTTVASGRYLYLMQVGNLKANGSVTLVR